MRRREYTAAEAQKLSPSAGGGGTILWRSAAANGRQKQSGTHLNWREQ